MAVLEVKAARAARLRASGARDPAALAGCRQPRAAPRFPHRRANAAVGRADAAALQTAAFHARAPILRYRNRQESLLDIPGI
jgi:hypothetical protein